MKIASAVNYGQITGGATGGSVTFSAQGETNVGISLQPAGTGVLSSSGTFRPTTGSNNAVDLGVVGTSIWRNVTIGGYYEGAEIADPAAPAANTGAVLQRQRGWENSARCQVPKGSCAGVSY